MARWRKSVRLAAARIVVRRTRASALACHAHLFHRAPYRGVNISANGRRQSATLRRASAAACSHSGATLALSALRTAPCRARRAITLHLLPAMLLPPLLPSRTLRAGCVGRFARRRGDRRKHRQHNNIAAAAAFIRISGSVACMVTGDYGRDGGKNVSAVTVNGVAASLSASRGLRAALCLAVGCRSTWQKAHGAVGRRMLGVDNGIGG